ncbi:excisionase family DNA binding protein [Lipingzhangella halophila]|uniref:Excisionase family DNA binding protein n=1 Tax=Lipingzhangella halophila TaxID=1783352 RepID=A0A7W7W566_9ACTN|nr:helix-turn-helix domain-containing protein [Lipingzhangella halophila]MBB4934378.1 excisionase family DNA binding protein [Lipingzhangella halophila]
MDSRTQIDSTMSAIRQQAQVILVKSGLTPEEVRALPVVLDAVTAGQLLGLGRTSTYRLLETGEFPAPAFRVGAQWRIPTAGVCQLLGLDYPLARTGHDSPPTGDHQQRK